MLPNEMFDAMVAEGDVVLDALIAHAVRDPLKPFIYYGEADRTISYAEFVSEVDSLAAGFQSLGVVEGAVVSVFTRNAGLAALAMFATWRAGGVYCPVNFLYAGKLLIHQLRDANPHLIVTDVALSPVLADVGADLILPTIVLHRPSRSDHDWIEAEVNFPSVDLYELTDILKTPGPLRPMSRSGGDVANIIYTSGTTGPAKGVVQPFRLMNQYTYPSRRLMNVDDVIHCDLPLYHVGGAFYLVAKAAWLGCTVALYDRFSPGQFWARIKRAEATHAVMLDVMIPWLMSAPATAGDHENTLNKVHMQPLPVRHREVAQRFGLDFVQAGFGQTESGLSFLSLIEGCAEGEGTPSALWKGLPRAEIKARAHGLGLLVSGAGEPTPRGLMGRPFPLIEATVLNEHDEACADEEVGQLALRPRFPDLILKSYLNRPEATNAAMANGWFHTGDACRRLADGTFVFVDRIGDVFRVRGENVSSFQVEDLIGSHAEIQAVAAVAVPASEGGEEDCAVFIQLCEGATLTADDVLVYAKANMPKYMVPRHIRFVEALPLTPTNKVEKYKLRQMLIAERSEAASAIP